MTTRIEDVHVIRVYDTVTMSIRGGREDGVDALWDNRPIEAIDTALRERGLGVRYDSDLCIGDVYKLTPGEYVYRVTIRTPLAADARRVMQQFIDDIDGVSYEAGSGREFHYTLSCEPEA